MGEVGVHVRIMPESPETDMEKVLGEVKKVLGEKLRHAEVRPFVFGLKVIEATFIVPDEEGVLDENVEKLKGIEGVQNVEVLQISLV